MEGIYKLTEPKNIPQDSFLRSEDNVPHPEGGESDGFPKEMKEHQTGKMTPAFTDTLPSVHSGAVLSIRERAEEHQEKVKNKEVTFSLTLFTIENPNNVSKVAERTEIQVTNSCNKARRSK